MPPATGRARTPPRASPPRSALWSWITVRGWIQEPTSPSTPGFRRLLHLHVDDSEPASRVHGHVQEGIDLATGATPTVIIEAGTYLENVLVNKPGLTLDGVGGVPTDVAIDPLLGDGITVSEDNVTIRDLRVTGAANGIAAGGVLGLSVDNVQADLNTIAGVNLSSLLGELSMSEVVAIAQPWQRPDRERRATVSLSDLTVTGNASDSTISSVATLNFTGSTGVVRDDITITGTTVQHTRDPLGHIVVNQPLLLAGVTNLNAFGDDEVRRLQRDAAAVGGASASRSTAAIHPGGTRATCSTLTLRTTPSPAT